MGRLKEVEHNQVGAFETEKSIFVKKARLNLNDLLKRREDEKKVDKKINIFIFSGAAVVGAAVLAILSL